MRKEYLEYLAPAMSVCYIKIISGFGGISDSGVWDNSGTGDAGGEITTDPEWYL